MEPEKLDRVLTRHYSAERARLEQHTRGPECPGLPVLRSVALGEAVPQVAGDHVQRCAACQRTVALFQAETAARPVTGKDAGAAWRGRRWAALAGAATLAAIAFALLRPGGGLPTQMARAPALEEEVRMLPSLLPDAGNRGSGEGFGIPDGESFLPTDRIRFGLGENEGSNPATPIAGTLTIHDAEDPPRSATRLIDDPLPCTQAPPAGGWPVGVCEWSFRNGEGDTVARGTFVVLVSRATRIVQRAEREWAGSPRRLFDIYLVLNLRERAGRILAGLPPAEQPALRRRMEGR